MGVFNKILHLGEGRKVKALEAIVPEVGAFEPEIQKLSDDQLAAKTTGRISTTSCPRRSPSSGKRPGGCWASATTTSS